jgi:hypothetical protein
MIRGASGYHKYPQVQQTLQFPYTPLRKLIVASTHNFVYDIWGPPQSLTTTCKGVKIYSVA